MSEREETLVGIPPRKIREMLVLQERIIETYPMAASVQCAHKTIALLREALGFPIGEEEEDES